MELRGLDMQLSEATVVSRGAGSWVPAPILNAASAVVALPEKIQKGLRVDLRVQEGGGVRVATLEFLEELGAGAFGSVWRVGEIAPVGSPGAQARGQFVAQWAIKCLSSDWVDLTGARRRERARMMREARIGSAFGSAFAYGVPEPGSPETHVVKVDAIFEVGATNVCMLMPQACGDLTRRFPLHKTKRYSLDALVLLTALWRVSSLRCWWDKTSEVIQDPSPLQEPPQLSADRVHLLRTALLHTVRGLAHLHAYGIFHRDIKPSNVLEFTEDGQSVFRLGDLGLAKHHSSHGRRCQCHSRVKYDRWLASVATVTSQTCMMGTPYFMAPEMLVAGSGRRGVLLADPGVTADMFSFAMTALAMIYGAYPNAETFLATSTTSTLPCSPTDIMRAVCVFFAVVHACMAAGLGTACNLAFVVAASTLHPAIRLRASLAVRILERGVIRGACEGLAAAIGGCMRARTDVTESQADLPSPGRTRRNTRRDE